MRIGSFFSFESGFCGLAGMAVRLFGLLVGDGDIEVVSSVDRMF